MDEDDAGVVTGACPGGPSGHCCWIGGRLCPLLRDDGRQAARRFVCTVRERAGSWPSAHRDPLYVALVKPSLEVAGLPDCGDWPRPGETCAECGVAG